MIAQWKKFYHDISTVHSTIIDKIYNSKFDDSNEIPNEYNLLSHKQVNYAIDLVMGYYQPFSVK